MKPTPFDLHHFLGNLAVNFFQLFFKNPISKLNAKFSSTLLLKVSWRNIEKTWKSGD